MREIKFRAYIEPDGEFPSGMFYGVWFDLTTVYILEQNWSKLVHPPVLISIGRECEGLHLEQFTGRKDSKGVEIYEGDILTGGAVVEYFDELTWDGGCPHPGFYCREWFSYSEQGELQYHNNFEGEYIQGNIHENPELME